MLQIKKVDQKSFVVTIPSDYEDKIEEYGITDEIIDWISDNVEEYQFYEIVQTSSNKFKKNNQTVFIVRIYEEDK